MSSTADSSRASSLAPGEPIIFESRTAPDVCLEVFGQKFHVHSTILKIHTEFFHKFLDSPDKQHVMSDGATVRHHWVTKVDEDGSGWMLTMDTKAGLSNVDNFQKNTSMETDGFKLFLMALYDLPYSFESIEQFLTVGEFARFYCALPKVSRTLTDAIHGSGRFFKKGLTSPTEPFLQTVIDFRHKALFMDAMCWLSGYHPSRSYRKSAIPSETCEVACFATLNKAIHQRIDTKLVSLQNALMHESFEVLRPDIQDLPKVIWESIGNCVGKVDDFASLYARVYIALCNYESLHSSYRKVSLSSSLYVTKLTDLLRNDLTFHPQLVTGRESTHKGHLFCNVLEDRDLPWDTTVISW